MRKVSAMVVIAALLCASSAFALGPWDWDVTCRVSTNQDEAGIPAGWYFYEYAWEIIENTAGAGAAPSTPNQACVDITGYAGDILFNVYGDSEAPDENDYPAVPALSSLGTYTENWLNGLGWTAFTGAYWLRTPGEVKEFIPAGDPTPLDGRTCVVWNNFTMDPDTGDEPGLGFYTSFLADAPPIDRQWGLENAHFDTGIVCAPTPEPVSAILLLLGLPAAAALRKRRD